jgi:tetratricopeptide (TPR) repeat protein
LAPTGKTSSAIANNLNSAIDTTSAAEHFQTGVKLAQQNKHGQSGTLQPPASGRMLPGGNVANQKSLSDEVRSHWQKAQDFDRNDQAEQALQEYKVVLAANPDSRTVRAIHHAMGNIYMKAKDYDNALTNFNLAINMGARERNLFRNRGMVYRALNQWQKALDDFNAAIEIDPSFAVAYHDRSKAYTALGRPDLAAAEAQKASELGYQPGSGRNR